MSGVIFNKVLVANRGAAAARVLRALDTLGIASVAVYSEADREAPYLARAGETVCIGAPPPRASYLNIDAIVAAARQTGADAVHPGYGFLSENPAFTQALNDAGIRFIGPSAHWIEAMGHKTRARSRMRAAGVPVGSGSDVLSDETLITSEARRIGFPVLVKPANGGGGIGMLPAHSEAELASAVRRAQSLSQRGFGSTEVYLERLLHRPRHIEFQIVADQHGNAMSLFERDCSVQRRHQKVLEEAPAPNIRREKVDALGRMLASTLGDFGYDSIGTVEMLYADGEFQFIEMNTRLQVEHGVTEMVTGIDIVAAQIRAAAGEKLGDILARPAALDGHAIEARVYAEDPERFLPSPGTLEVYRPPAAAANLRIETGYAEGNQVTPFYDPMVAKVIAHGPTRGAAIDTLQDALSAFAIRGVSHNIPALQRALSSDAFRNGQVHTGMLSEVMQSAAA
jgi:acetyl-CoA carboxylase biotin carboxylase subunit